MVDVLYIKHIKKFQMTDFEIFPSNKHKFGRT